MARRPRRNHEGEFKARAEGVISAGEIRQYPLRDAVQAHRDVESRRTIGSIILVP